MTKCRWYQLLSYILYVAHLQSLMQGFGRSSARLAIEDKLIGIWWFLSLVLTPEILMRHCHQWLMDISQWNIDAGWYLASGLHLVWVPNINDHFLWLVDYLQHIFVLQHSLGVHHFYEICLSVCAFPSAYYETVQWICNNWKFINNQSAIYIFLILHIIELVQMCYLHNASPTTNYHVNYILYIF